MTIKMSIQKLSV